MAGVRVVCFAVTEAQSLVRAWYGDPREQQAQPNTFAEWLREKEIEVRVSEPRELDLLVERVVAQLCGY
jgi:hypothetical protein